MRGRLRLNAIAFANELPTNNEPNNPGPFV